jgi:hypothetical protein
MAAAAGLFALWACGGGGGGVPARLLAVEPLPANLALLRRNLRARAPAQQARPRLAPAPAARASAGSAAPPPPPRRAAPATRRARSRPPARARRSSRRRCDERAACAWADAAVRDVF